QAVHYGCKHLSENRLQSCIYWDINQNPIKGDIHSFVGPDFFSHLVAMLVVLILDIADAIGCAALIELELAQNELHLLQNELAVGADDQIGRDAVCSTRYRSVRSERQLHVVPVAARQIARA